MPIATFKCDKCWRVGDERLGCNCFAWTADHWIECQGGRRCRQPAVFIVRIHAIHCCTNTGLDRGGNTVHVMCRACTAAAGWRLGEMIGDMYAAIPDGTPPVECHCTSCGRRIMELHDIFSVETLVLSVKDSSPQ